MLAGISEPCRAASLRTGDLVRPRLARLVVEEVRRSRRAAERFQSVGPRPDTRTAAPSHG